MIPKYTAAVYVVHGRAHDRLAGTIRTSPEISISTFTVSVRVSRVQYDWLGFVILTADRVHKVKMRRPNRDIFRGYWSNRY